MEDSYKFFVPIDLAESVNKTNSSSNEKSVYVKGFASTPDLDLQGEVVNPIGIGIDYFTKSGWINYEHRQDMEFAIGEPTGNCYIDPEKGLFIEAKLYMDNEHAQKVWKLAKSLQKSGSQRKLGFSIEGSVKKRNNTKKNVIDEMFITNVAITKSPANPNATWDMFVKSMVDTGHDINPETQTGGATLRREVLGRSLRNLAGLYPKTTDDLEGYEQWEDSWKEIIDYMSEEESITDEESIVLLQLYQGMSRGEAEHYIRIVSRVKGVKNSE